MTTQRTKKKTKATSNCQTASVYEGSKPDLLRSNIKTNYTGVKDLQYTQYAGKNTSKLITIRAIDSMKEENKAKTEKEARNEEGQYRIHRLLIKTIITFLSIYSISRKQ